MKSVLFRCLLLLLAFGLGLASFERFFRPVPNVIEPAPKMAELPDWRRNSLVAGNTNFSLRFVKFFRQERYLYARLRLTNQQPFTGWFYGANWKEFHPEEQPHPFGHVQYFENGVQARETPGCFPLEMNPLDARGAVDFDIHLGNYQEFRIGVLVNWEKEGKPWTYWTRRVSLADMASNNF
ncbi:MAG: hypothetical protein K1Y36_19365 [Blastocatellia bacterium]|nr:hypothetical protein [Blastocatellia bacterium]